MRIVLTVMLLAGIAAPGASAAEPPRIETGVRSITLRERGALLVETFDTELSRDRWRIWHSNPNAVDFAVKDGRYEIRARGRIGHNGLWSLNAAQRRDVVLVGRMDARSEGGDPHELLLHLCGGDGARSPDHWAEVALRDVGPDRADFTVLAAVPGGTFIPPAERVTVTRPKEHDGFLARITLEGGRNLCTLEVRESSGRWRSLAEPFPLHLRTVHCEVKARSVYGANDEATSTVAWFDDVRLYPRPASHPVMIRLVTADGGRVFSRGRSGEGWPPMIQIGNAHCRSAIQQPGRLHAPAAKCSVGYLPGGCKNPGGRRWPLAGRR
jgi:hypothetical protein